MSIKLKIALYNTFLISLVVLLLLFFMNSISAWVVEYSTTNQLKFIIEQNAEELEWDDGELDVEDVNFYENHISTLIYSHDGYLLMGSLPFLQDITAPLWDREVTTVTIREETYLLYDYLVTSRKHDDVFLRGVVSVSEVTDTVHSLFFLTLCALPCIILFAGWGSYSISKSSMKPLEKIMETASDITHGDDLSRRISLGEGNDEIFLLSQTFDTMFSRLEQAFLAEKQFTSDVSHELRTPISVILAECEYQLESDSLPLNERESLLLIQRQGKKMQTMITALLNFIRLDNGVHKPLFEEVDISELIVFLWEEHSSLLEKPERLEVSVPPSCFCWVDYGMMMRVISNLIDNGFKYGTEESSVTVTLCEEENQVKIQVTDNGIGIASENLSKIFHRFYQIEEARTGDSDHSMGLGLSMVEQLVHCHHGTITVESQLKKGSTFTVTLPKKQDDS